MEKFTIGDYQNEGRNRAMKSIAIFASLVVYLAMLSYTAVHNWTLLQRGVPEELRLWAIVGVVALEISAFALPIALHWWTHQPLQRLAAFAFYVLDLGLLWLNVVLDFSLVAGTWTEFPEWLALYLHFGVPATPLIAGLGWSILWLLDPSQRDRAMIETLRAATREALASKVVEAAKEAEINDLVQDAAQLLARGVVEQTLGSSRNGRQPHNKGSNPTTNGDGRPNFLPGEEGDTVPSVDLKRLKER